MEDLIFPGIIGLVIFFIWLYFFIKEKINLLKRMEEAFRAKPLLAREIMSLRKNNRLKTTTISELERVLKAKDEYYSVLQNVNNISIEKISELYSNFLTLQYDLSANYLKTKKHPAQKEAQRITELKQETKNHIERFKQMQYKYEALVNLFPELTNYIDDFSIIKELNDYSKLKEVVETYDRVRDYIPKQEYERLSEDERNQKALDNYNARQKTNWQIGRDYEMYCAYKYRVSGNSVEQFGIDKKFEDLDRDLIAHRKSGDIHIVQCKYWSSKKVIHEKHIAQLYGTTIMYKLERSHFFDIKVIPVFMTNIDISETAKRFAKELGVLMVANFPMGKFPQIKCNINNGNRIYHLPFDQQYDRTKIELKGEFNAFTVKEATEKGFRRAYRYYGINNNS